MSFLKENVLHCQFIQKMAHFFWLTSSPRLTRHPDDESPVLGSTGGIYKVLTFSKRSPTNNCKRIHFLSLHIFQLDLLLTLTCSTLRGLLQPTLRSSCKNAYRKCVKMLAVKNVTQNLILTLMYVLRSVSSSMSKTSSKSISISSCKSKKSI